jgi:hypothetical protein
VVGTCLHACKWGTFGGYQDPSLLGCDTVQSAVSIHPAVRTLTAIVHNGGSTKLHGATSQNLSTDRRTWTMSYRNPWAQRRKCPVRTERDRCGQVTPHCSRTSMTFTVKNSCSAKCPRKRGCFMYKHPALIIIIRIIIIISYKMPIYVWKNSTPI